MRAEIEASPVLLSRYSAVTFIGHRIHYDHDYARDVELYPGLIVHGPLQGPGCCDWCRRNLARCPKPSTFAGVRRFSSNRGKSPGKVSLDQSVCATDRLELASGDSRIGGFLIRSDDAKDAEARAFRSA